MSEGERIRVVREELFTPGVERELEQRRAARRSRELQSEPVSAVRRVLLSGLFYLPLAGMIGAVVAWALLEPSFDDLAKIGGEVTLVNDAPFDVRAEGAATLTVGRREAIVLPVLTKLEPGLDGEPAYLAIDEIRVGDHVEAVGLGVDRTRLVAVGVRPASPARAERAGQTVKSGFQWTPLLLLPLTAGAIALLIFLAEGVASRNWLRMAERGLVGTGLTVLFAFLALIPAGVLMLVFNSVLRAGSDEAGLVTVRSMPAAGFLVSVGLRSAAWAVVGAGLGLGVSLFRSTRAQLRNTVMGGSLGGAVGGLFFDPMDRFFGADTVFVDAWLSRAVGLAAVGIAIGLFVAISERLAREGWLRVRTGPLAGKSFVLYRSPTTIGSSPRSDVYLFKDAEISPSHAAVHRVGGHYEVEDLGTRCGTVVGGSRVARRRLVSGDQIVLGATVLEFEERARARAGGATG